MAYAGGNPKTKKELKERIARGESVAVWQPSPWGDAPVKNGIAYVEGPHYPQPHKWYAQVRVIDGVIVEVIK